MRSHDIGRLETQVKEVHEQLVDLVRGEKLLKLLIDFRHPGYTTPAEFRMLSGIIASLKAQAQGIAAMQETLLSASSAIVEAADAKR